MKLSTLDDRFVFTAAAFEVFRNNVFTENTATIPIHIFLNAQDSRGIDADLQVKPAAAMDDPCSPTRSAQTANLTAVPVTPSQVGNWPVGVPAYIFNLWTTYEFAGAGINGFTAGIGGGRITAGPTPIAAIHRGFRFTVIDGMFELVGQALGRAVWRSRTSPT